MGLPWSTSRPAAVAAPTTRTTWQLCTRAAITRKAVVGTPSAAATRRNTAPSWRASSNAARKGGMLAHNSAGPHRLPPSPTTQTRRGAACCALFPYHPTSRYTTQTHRRGRPLLPALFRLPPKPVGAQLAAFSLPTTPTRRCRPPLPALFAYHRRQG